MTVTVVTELLQSAVVFRAGWKVKPLEAVTGIVEVKMEVVVVVVRVVPLETAVLSPASAMAATKPTTPTRRKKRTVLKDFILR